MLAPPVVVITRLVTAGLLQPGGFEPVSAADCCVPVSALGGGEPAASTAGVQNAKQEMSPSNPGTIVLLIENLRLFCFVSSPWFRIESASYGNARSPRRP